MQFLDIDLYEIPDQSSCVFILFKSFEDKILSDIILESEGIFQIEIIKDMFPEGW